MALSVMAIMGGLEAGFVFAIRDPYESGSHSASRGLTFFGILASVLIAHTHRQMLCPWLVIPRLNTLELLHQSDDIVTSFYQGVLLTEAQSWSPIEWLL